VKAGRCQSQRVITRPNIRIYGKGSPQSRFPGWKFLGIHGNRRRGLTIKKLEDQVCELNTQSGGMPNMLRWTVLHWSPYFRRNQFEDARWNSETVFTVWFQRISFRANSNLERNYWITGHSGNWTMGLQMAKAWGCSVYSTAGVMRKLILLKKLNLGNGYQTTRKEGIRRSLRKMRK